MAAAACDLDQSFQNVARTVSASKIISQVKWRMLEQARGAGQITGTFGRNGQT